MNAPAPVFNLSIFQEVEGYPNLVGLNGPPVVAYDIHVAGYPMSYGCAEHTWPLSFKIEGRHYSYSFQAWENTVIIFVYAQGLVSGRLMSIIRPTNQKQLLEVINTLQRDFEELADYIASQVPVPSP